VQRWIQGSRTLGKTAPLRSRTYTGVVLISIFLILGCSTFGRQIAHASGLPSKLQNHTPMQARGALKDNIEAIFRIGADGLKDNFFSLRASPPDLIYKNEAHRGKIEHIENYGWMLSYSEVSLSNESIEHVRNVFKDLSVSFFSRAGDNHFIRFESGVIEYSADYIQFRAGDRTAAVVRLKDAIMQFGTNTGIIVIQASPDLLEWRDAEESYRVYLRRIFREGDFQAETLGDSGCLDFIIDDTNTCLFTNKPEQAKALEELMRRLAWLSDAHDSLDHIPIEIVTANSS
jgi:hypothetical protein